MKLPKKIYKFEDIVKVLRALEKINESEEKNKFTRKIRKNGFPNGLWFRGELKKDPKDKLQPGVFRRDNKLPHLDEPSITNHLQTRIPDLYKITNPFDKLSFAQHYKIRTRLLDWSESIFAAMYFAVTDYEKEDKDIPGRLYILNAYSLNAMSGMGEGKGRIHTSTDYGTLFRAEMAYSFSADDWAQRLNNKYPEFNFEENIETSKLKNQKKASKKHCSAFFDPVAVTPVLTHQRMLVQSSAFTLHGGSFCWENEHKPEKFPDKHKNLTIYLEIPIPANKKQKIKDDLFKFGIHEGTLFPEIDHQKEFLEKVFRRT